MVSQKKKNYKFLPKKTPQKIAKKFDFQELKKKKNLPARFAEFFVLSISDRISPFFTFTLASSPGRGILRMFNIAWNRCRIRRKIQNLIDFGGWGFFVSGISRGSWLVDPSVVVATAYVFQRTIVPKKYI